MLLTRQEKGKAFENRAQELFERTTFPVLREQTVRNKYGNPSSAIDHLIFCNDFLIAIQDKLISSKPDVSKINHFIQSTKVVEDFEKKNMICIYISPTELTKPSKASFDHENMQGGKRKFISLTNSNENELLQTVQKYFHDELRIFFYEDDGACIMADLTS